MPEKLLRADTLRRARADLRLPLRPRPPRPCSRNVTDDVRTAASATFAFAGFATASWAVRIPDISAQVGAGHGALGLALLCLSLGALATMRLTGSLVERVGAGRTTAVALALVALAVVLPGLASSVGGLALALSLFGAATGALNVAMNSVGVRLENTVERSTLPSLHAAFSFGGLGGSVVGGLAATVGAPAPHLALVALAGLAVASSVAPRLRAADVSLPAIREPDAAKAPEDSPAAAATTPGAGPAPGPTPAAVRGTLVALGVIAGCTAFAEGALSDWAALHLAEDLHAPTVLAAAGYAGFSLAMACGRLAGHRLVAAWGSTRLLVLGPLLAAFGMLLGAWSSSITTALLGLVLVGLGLANVFPLAIGRAGALGGSRGVGLASTVGYSGMLGGPALIGFLASRVGLPAALSSVAVAAVVASALAARVAAEPLPARVRLVLPWDAAEVTARLRSAVAPVGPVARGHAHSLHLLVPPHQARPRSPQGTAVLFETDTMLGRG